MEKLRFEVSNIHCEDCELLVRQVFSKCFKLVDYEGSVPNPDEIPGADMVLYKQQGNEVILYSKGIQLKIVIKKMIKMLRNHGFDVLIWEYFVDDKLTLLSRTTELDTENPTPNSNRILDEVPDIFHGFGKWLQLYKENRYKKEHLKNCKKCQLDEQSKSRSVESSDESFETVVEKEEKEFRAVLYVGDMTCASCVASVGEVIKQILQNSKTGGSNADEPNYSVNLVQHSAVVVVPNKQMINSITNAISDAGYECRILEVLPIERSINSKVTASIGGMSCVACAVSITSAVKELPFLLDCNINSVSKSGVFVMEQSDKNLENLKETVEDCGFDFEVIEISKINYVLSKKQSRTINLSVKDMFCNHCPELINQYLNNYGEAVVIEDELSLKHPFIKFTYIPDIGKGVTLRRILDDLNHLRANDSDGYIIDMSTDGSFKCDLVIPMSMEEHFQKLSRKEVYKIARRLVVATIFAIPTFIFGIVAMLLLPKSNSFRIWVEEPLWTGNVSRNTWVLFFLSTPVYFFAADVFHVKAFKEVKSLWLHKNSFKKRLFKFGSMSLLMCLGTSVAYWASLVLLILSSQQEPRSHMAFHTTYFDTVVFLTFFLLIGRLLESISKNKTGNAVAGLGDLKTTKASLVDKDEDNDDERFVNDRVVDVKFLEIGDFIRISPGDSPPVDCVIVSNEAEFDESALTGESMPVKHIPGHQIFSGTVNVGNRAVIGKILSLENDSLIDQILNTVREGQLKKAPIERTADTLTGYFVPVIVLLAIIVFIIWISLSYSGALPAHYLDIDIGGWAMWSLEFSIAVFCIACPCGIGLAAPTALFVGAGLAAKHGILAKGGGAAFQDASNTKVVCFDKTGTLTYGDLRVTDYLVVDEKLKSVGYQLSRDLELSSKHPLAEAIKKFVIESDVNLTSSKVPNVETIPGKGLRGEIIHESPNSNTGIWKEFNPTEVILGNELLLVDYGVEINEKQKSILKQWKNGGKSVILTAVKGSGSLDKFQLTTMFGCKDQIRAETVSVINHLSSIGIESWMITGDNALTAISIASQIGIPEDHVIAQVLPTEKQLAVKRIKNSGKVVAMVGDGINDAPALSTADIGIALSSGTDLAVTSSDFILLNKVHPLSSVVTLFDLSKTVFRRVKFNFSWALVYNVIGIPIAAGVIYPINNSRLSPVWSSAAMAASSVSVVLSSLALNLYRPKSIEESGEIQEEIVKQWSE